MSKKLLCLVFCCTCLLAAAGTAFAGGTRVGGQIKMTMFDYVDGKHNSTTGSAYTGCQFTMMDLYLSQEISDKVSIDIEPTFEATTMPTPSFGNDIGAQSSQVSVMTHGMNFGFHGWRKAVVKVVLPEQYEASFGIVKPRFSWEYGAELFYQDEIIGSKSSNSDYLGAMHDSGVEIYKPFELGDISLPTYLYLLNGSGGYKISLSSGANEYGDTNRTPMVMLHVEPEIGNLKLLASYAYGTWDVPDLKAVNRWAGGVDYTFEKFNLRAEYFGGSWQDALSGIGPKIADLKPSGYYAKVFYRIAPWVRAMVHYDYVDNNYQGWAVLTPAPQVTTTKNSKEVYKTITPGLQFFVADSAIFIVQYDIADWERTPVVGASDKLEFGRFVAGWRVIF